MLLVPALVNLPPPLSEEERQRILLTCNEPQYASLPPGQIVPILAEHGYRRNQGRCLGLGLQVQTRYGVGTFPISPPVSKGSGCISTW